MVNTSCHKNQNDPINQAILQSYHLRRCEFGTPKSRVSGDVWGFYTQLARVWMYRIRLAQIANPPLAYFRAMTSLEDNVNIQ